MEFKIQNSKFKIPIVGGDITHGERVVINIAMIGEVSKKLCRFRSGARVGDLICVTGALGPSTAGLKFLQKYYGKSHHSIACPQYACVRQKSLLKTFKKEFFYIKGIHIDSLLYCVGKHLEPSVPIDCVYDIAPHASSIIDVSDGLGSEVRHICEESGVGSFVYAEKIPIDKRVREVAWFFGDDPLKYALSGGEDFEMVFTIDRWQYEKHIRQFKHCLITVVGEIVSKKGGIVLMREGKKVKMPEGFEHF